MKKSISYLPLTNQKDLEFIIEGVLQRIKETQMIILFGSYARNNHVEFDKKFEFGRIQFYVSDYDILIVTSGEVSEDISIGALNDVIDTYYKMAKDPDRRPPLQFIIEDIEKLNKDLEERRYFYTQIKQEGIILYDSEKFQLASSRELSFEEIKQQSQEYFDAKYERANGFSKGAKFYSTEKDYQLASFNLHQACENYTYAIRLVFTLENQKQHNLEDLLNSVNEYSEDILKVFPQDTSEEKRLFKLIKSAYVEGRYNPKFVVTKEDIEALIPKVELLRDITKRICEAKIKEYGEQK